MKKQIKASLIMVSILTASPASATMFDFNDGTGQGWRRIGLYDDGGLTPIPGFFSDDPAPFFDGQNSPGSPPTFDPIGDGIGSTGVGTGGFTTPASPTSSAFLHWDLVSPDLSSDVQWQGISAFTYDVTGGGMFSVNGDNFVQAVLHIQKSDGSDSFFSDRIFNPIPISQPYNQSSWTTHTVDMSSIPAGSTLLDVNLRIFFDTKEGYDGFIQVDNVNPIPIPAALPLFASALAFFGWLARRR